MNKVIGWSDSKIINDEIAVLAETRNGKQVVFLGELPNKPSSTYIKEINSHIGNSIQEDIINNGRALPFDKAQEIYKQIKQSDYDQDLSS